MNTSPSSTTLAEKIRRPLRRRGLLMRPRLLRDLAKIAEARPSRGNEIDVFESGDLLYEAMLGEIALARRIILFEMYMFRSDDTAWRFARALAEKAKDGVEVRFLYDAVGSLDAEPEIFRHLRDAGVHVVEFRPVRPGHRRFRLFGRNHRKIIVIDGRVGFIGGANIGDYWSESRWDKAWRDTHLRLRGHAACDLALLFAETWHRETGELLALKEEESVVRVPIADGEPTGAVLIVAGRGGYRRRIRKLYQWKIGQAHRQILITSSYFVPDRRIRWALCRAAQRGVEVRLLLPEDSDVSLADYAGRYFYARFLRHGIRVHLWQPSILHAKTMVVDHSWGMVGSSNFDSLSLNYNLEANAVLLDPDAVARLEEHFWSDLTHARELGLEEWRRRSWRERLLEWLASLLSPWL